MSELRLTRIVLAEPATALLLLEPTAERVLSARARVGGAKLFRVDGGVLVTGSRRIDAVVPGAIRLRAWAPSVLVPTDADLVPALVPDEATALTAERGLVFLPGGGVLSFDPRAPLQLATLVRTGSVTRSPWSALPERPAQASRLTAIRVELPPEAPEAILESGAPPASGEGAPSPGKAGAGERASFGLGKALFRAGEALNLDGLKKAGAKWIDGLLSKAPSLGEGILGRQEAALRELLQKLRSGDVEDALRRALPLPEPGGGRGATAARDAQLPVNDLAYSLKNVLTGGGKGPASVWFGGFDVQKELAAEYRKAAEKAARDGDHRRAAFIYGKLLRDYRQAAHVLAQAGLHRDAAILYLTKCDDKLAAARAFAAAGETDRAVELYREKGEYVQAGDLLRSSGDEEGALVEFQRAADLRARRGDWLGAADLLQTRAARADLAIACLEEGWSHRATHPTFACGVRLLDLCSRERRTERLIPLVDEAEGLLAGAGRETEAASFWSAVSRLPETAAGAVGPELADELRDRARLGVALKLGQRAEWDTKPARVVSELFGVSGAWSPGVHADARFAVTAAIKKRRGDRRETLSRIKVANGIVTAVACANGPGLVFLGMSNGEIWRFGAEERSVERLSLHHPVVTSLGCDPTGRLLVATRGEPPDCEILSYSRRGDGLYYLVESREVESQEELLLSNVSVGGEPRVVLWNGERLELLDCPQLRSLGAQGRSSEEAPSALLTFLPHHWLTAGALVFAGERVGRKPLDLFLGWTPDVPWGVSLRAAVVGSLQTEQDSIEVVGLSEAGVISWSRIPLDGDATARASVAHRAAGYLAATLFGPGLVAACTSSAIEWLQVSSGEIERTATTPLDVKNAVACFALDATRELAVVTADGHVICAHLPGN